MNETDVVFRTRLGAGIRVARQRCGFTQTELAKLIDSADAQVSRWENGKALPRLKTLEAIAAVLDTKPEIFFRDAL